MCSVDQMQGLWVVVTSSLEGPVNSWDNGGGLCGDELNY